MGWKERVWGYDGAGGMIQGFAAGYFLWDLMICIRWLGVFGWGLLAHAVAALVVFSLGFVSPSSFHTLSRFASLDSCSGDVTYGYSIDSSCIVSYGGSKMFVCGSLWQPDSVSQMPS